MMDEVMCWLQSLEGQTVLKNAREKAVKEIATLQEARKVQRCKNCYTIISRFRAFCSDYCEEAYDDRGIISPNPWG